MVLVVLLDTPVLPALAPKRTPPVPPPPKPPGGGPGPGGQGIAYRPWWHTRGHLSDYASCRPCDEEDAAGVVAKLVVREEDAARPVKPAQYRDDFINIANEVPELAAIFLPEDVQPELIPPGQSSSLPLQLHPGSLHRHLSSLYRRRTSAPHTAAPPGPVAVRANHSKTSIGFEMQRLWLDAAYGHLGGARGRTDVQRFTLDMRWSNAFMSSQPAEAEPSYFYLPTSLCEELQLDPLLCGPSKVPSDARSLGASSQQEVDAQLRSEQKPKAKISKGKLSTFRRKAGRKAAARAAVTSAS